MPKKDEIITLAMYSFWAANQNADLSFLEGEAEGCLAKWKVMLTEEGELMFVTASGAVNETEGGVEVSSEGLKVPLYEEAMSSKLAALIEDVREELAGEAAQKATDVGSPAAQQ